MSGLMFLGACKVSDLILEHTDDSFTGNVLFLFFVALSACFGIACLVCTLDWFYRLAVAFMGV